MEADTRSEISSAGADVDSLLSLARGPRSELSDALKKLGFTKMGHRKKIEQQLVAEAAAMPAPPAAPAAVEPASPKPTGSSAPPSAAPAPAPAPEPPPPPSDPAERLQAEGTAAFKVGNHEKAAKLYSEALGLRPDDATLLSNRSAAYLCLGRHEAALDDATACVRLRPSWGKAHGRHGAALAALGCAKDAVAAYERGLKHTPDSTQMQTELSRLRTLVAEQEVDRRHQEEMAQMRREQQAEAEAAEAARAAEANPEAAAAAAAAAEEASSGGGGGQPSKKGAAAAAAAAAAADGGAGKKKGEPAAAAAAAAAPPPKPKEQRIGRNADGTGGQTYVRVADTDELQAQGTEAFKVGDYEEAQEKWTAALRRRPDDATLLSNRSAAWLALGEKKLALEDAERCVEVKPDWYKGYGRLGAALYAFGKLDDAIAAYKKGLALNGDSPVLRTEFERLQGEKAAGGPGRGMPGAAGGGGGGGGGAGGGEGGDEGGLALTGLALARECNRLGRPEQAVRELDKLLTNKVADAELYCERSIAHLNCHRLSCAVEDASTAVYLYEHQHDPELKPWENPKELGIKLMTRQEKNELARKEGRSFLLRGQAETRLCDYDTAMRTYQLGCKADARLGPEALKDLRTAWYAAKELCRGWRRAGVMKNPERRKMAFKAQRLPALHDIAQFERPEDKALALRNMAGIHTKWKMHEDAIELLTTALTHTPNDQYLTYLRGKEHTTMGNYELALPDAMTVVRERPGWIEGIIFCGNVQGKLGMWSEAAAHWHEALVLQPHNPNLRRDLERATVEMGEEEANRYRKLIAQRQTGDICGSDAGNDYAVELESYEENGREFFRPKGTGERLEKEKLEEYQRIALEQAKRDRLKQSEAAKAEAEACRKLDEAEARERERARARAEAEAEGGAEGGAEAEAEGGGAEEEEEGRDGAAPTDVTDPLVAAAASVDGDAAAGDVRPDFLKAALDKTSSSAAPKPRLVGDKTALKHDPSKAKAKGGDDDDGSWGKYGKGDLGSSDRYSGGGAPLLGRLVKIDGLLARPALNGTTGTCTSYNAETGRYNVQQAKGETIALKPSNLTPTSAPAGGGGGGGGGEDGEDGEDGSGSSYTPSAEAAKAKADAEAMRKKSIGQRMATKRNTKGIACMKGMGGMFASEEKRQQKAAARAANPISEDYDPVQEMEAERLAKLSPEACERERKANELKNLANKHLGGMDMGRALSFLTDAIKLCPEKRELWSNRSHAYEMLHDHVNALSDGEKAIECDPTWPKGYLRTARALMSLERGGEAAARLRQALEISPRDQILLDAYKEAQVLAQCTMRTERAMRASQLPTFNGVGDSDIVGIERGACKHCDCNAYIQKHGRTTVMLQGRGRVRQDNDPSFFMCARCGHDCVAHKDLRREAESMSKKPVASRERAGGPAGISSSLPKAPDWIPEANMAQNTYTNGANGTRGGIDSSYYYAAKPNSKPPAPQRVDPKAAARSGGGGAWTSQRAAAAAQKDDWEAELDPSLLKDYDPLAAAGTETAQAKATAADVAADPFAQAASGGGGGGGGGGLDDADPLACRPCR